MGGLYSIISFTTYALPLTSLLLLAFGSCCPHKRRVFTLNSALLFQNHYWLSWLFIILSFSFSASFLALIASSTLANVPRVIFLEFIEIVAT